jgi:hypothetical protein
LRTAAVERISRGRTEKCGPIKSRGIRDHPEVFKYDLAKTVVIELYIAGGTMARLDEQPVNIANVEPVNEEPRKGDVLGLSGSEVPKTPDPSTEYDPDSIAQRPESTRIGDMLGLAEKSEERTPNASAAGIDTGSRGSGAGGAEE